MTLVINARKKPPPLHLYKALLMAQVKTVILHAHARIKVDAKIMGSVWFTGKNRPGGVVYWPCVEYKLHCRSVVIKVLP